MKEIGQTLRRARKSAGLTLEQLALEVGVSAATLSRAESGRGSISGDRLRRYADAVGLNIADFGQNPPAADERSGVSGVFRPDGTGSWRSFPPLVVPPSLRAAIDAFVSVGYHGTSVRDIAARAGLSVPGLYHHYASKHQLLVAVMDLTMSDFRDRCEAAVKDGATARERFILLAECFALYHSYRRELAFVGASEMRSLDQADRERIAAIRTHCQHLVDDQVRDLVDSGEALTPDARDAARAVVTMLVGIANWYQANGPLSPEEIARRYVGHASALISLVPAAV